MEREEEPATGLGRWLLASPPPQAEVPWEQPSVSSASFGAGVRVHAVRTGFVRVKEAHRTLVVPDALRLPAIAFGRAWTEWMPVFVYVLEHPEGLWLVDAGLSEETLSPSHYVSDPATEFVYRNFLRFRFRPEERIDRHLARLGLSPADLRGVVLTHRHADHADGLAHLPSSALAYVGAADWPLHQGALPWALGRRPELIAGDAGEPFGSLPRALPVTRDGAVSIVPLPGHSPGHLGVLLRAGSSELLFAGDAAFSAEQVEQGQLAGVVEDPRLARGTLAALRQFLRRPGATAVFAHEPASLGRLRDGVASRSRSP